MRVSGQDTHSVLVDYDTFVNVTMPDKTDPQLQARRSGLPAEAGLSGCRRRIPLPTINDDYTGRAPDIGAYESGRPVPQYGPRN